MDLYQLHPTTWEITNQVSNFDSFIWTERYTDFGEFEITFSDIETGLARFPIGQLVSHRDTWEVMAVDTHTISQNEQGVYVLKVSGKEYSYILNHRVSTTVLTSPMEDSKYDWGDDMGSAEIVVALAGSTLGDNAFGSISPFDKITGYQFWPAGGVEGEYEADEMDWDVPLGKLSDFVLPILKNRRLGMRTVRPHEGGLNGSELWTQVYRGTDRAVDNAGGLPPIIFDAGSGHLKSLNYLQSNREAKTIAYVYSNLGAVAVVRSGASGGGSGFDRRVLYVDASDVTKVPATSNIIDILKKRGRLALSKDENRRQTVLDVTVSPDIPYKYSSKLLGDYYLGDFVTVQADFGISEKMMVSEYIRSDTKEGDIGYPTLVEIPPIS